MLSLEDVKNISFRKANFGGYKPEDVDAFVDDLQISYEEIANERKNMMSTIEKLKSQLQKYREDDNSIKDVILNARKVAEKSLFDAEAKTSEMINNAAESSKKMIEKAKKEVSLQNEISKKIKSEAAKLKNKLENVYKHHMEIINEISEEDIAVDDKFDDEISVSNHPTLTSEEKVDKIISDVAKNGDFLHISGECSKNVSGGVTSQIDAPKKDLSSKFKNLEFGENYDVTHAIDDSGIYEGIFKKDK